MERTSPIFNRDPDQSHADVPNVATNTSHHRSAIEGQYQSPVNRRPCTGPALTDDVSIAAWLKSTAAATKAETNELLVKYVELFCADVNAKFENPSNRVNYLNRQVLGRAHRGKYSDTKAFHASYDKWYLISLDGSSDTMRKVGFQLNQFASAGDTWWRKALRMEITQKKRLALVKEVVELVKDDEGTLSDLWGKIDKLCDSYYQEEEDDSEWVPTDMLSTEELAIVSKYM